MDLTPSQIVHDLLLDDVDRVLRSDAIWNCVHCETCTARCPQGVDVSGLLMWARAESWRSGKVRPDQPVASYFASFAENLYLYGRSAELPLTLMHKVKSEDYMRDIPLGFRMISRGLLPFFSRPRHAATFRRLADRARRKESERS